MAILAALSADSSIPLIAYYAPVFLLATFVLYRFHQDPLKDIPGPLICRLTPLWSWIHSYIGDEVIHIDNLHKKYGPVVRISPDEVVISDGAALALIYSEKGGFLKAPCYTNFDFEGHRTIFSAIDPNYRSVRSKAVMPMFSTSNIRARNVEVQICVDNFIARLQREANASRQAYKQTGKAIPVNVLNVTRGMAIDAVTSYLFGKDYNGLNEKTSKLTASLFVDSVVACNRFFYFAPWLFHPLINFTSWLQPASHEEDVSVTKVNDFTAPLVEQPPRDDTYQSRLLRAGCTGHEADVQMKDVIFAGTDSTGNTLATVLFHLSKRPDVMQKLRDEIAETEAVEGPNYNPQNLKYLDAVVREGLRMAMANPCRLPRQVPPSGFHFKSSTGRTYYFPPGSIVGLQPYTLHFNPEVFLEPHMFNPERWLDASPEMLRDAIPFGLGPRQCIAKNLAMFELCLAVRAVVKNNVLQGARPAQDQIPLIHWFNAKIVDDQIVLVWE